MGHIAHQALDLKINARAMAIMVVIRQMLTNMAPMIIKLPPEAYIL